MNQDRLKRLNKFYQVHAENLRLDDLLPRLFAQQIFTAQERQRLEKEAQAKGTIAQSHLLLELLKNKNNRAYDLFVHALEATGQSHLAQHLQHELSPSAVLSAADKQKIQANYAKLIENIKITQVMAILRDEENFFTPRELSRIDDTLNENKKTDILLTDVILKGSYKHLALLKKTLTEVGQGELGKLLPVDMAIIGVTEEGPAQSVEPTAVDLEVELSMSRPFENLRAMMVTRIADPSQDLRKRLIVMYELNTLKVEADLSNDYTFSVTMLPRKVSFVGRIEEDVKNGHLALLLKQYSHIRDDPPWKIIVKQRPKQPRGAERQEDLGLASRQDVSSKIPGGESLTESERSAIERELPTFMDHLNMNLIVPKLYGTKLMSQDKLEKLESLGADQLKAAFLYEEVLVKAESFRNVEVMRSILQSVDQEGLAMLLPKRAESSSDVPFTFEGEIPPKPKAYQEKRQTLGPSQLPIAKSVIFSMLTGKDHTPFDLWITLKKYKGTVYETPHQLKNEEGLNLLHVCVDKGRLSLLVTLMHMGWWGHLSKEKISDQSINEHKGRIARQIAESKRTRKPLDEVNMFTEWENSLSSVMKAARQGDLPKVTQQLRIEGAESHYRDTNNGNALYWAVVSGSMQVLRSLLDFGLDHSMKTKKSETLLHIACMLGQHHMVETFINECGVDATAEDQNHKTAFDRCAENGDIDTLIALMKCRLTPPGSFPVVTAYAGRKQCLEYCLEQLKMNVDSKDVYDRTPLHRAAEGSKYDIAKYLVEKGADVTLLTCSLRNLLHIVAEAGNINIFHLVVDELEKRDCLMKMINEQDRYNGVDLCFLIRGRDRGRDAWHYVEVQRNKAPIFLKKTKAGNVDVAAFGSVIKSGWGVNPEQDIIDFIEDMFKTRRLNKSAPLDQTPLHIAIFKGQIEVVNVLLQKGASVNTKDRFGLTPLMIAAAKGFLDVIKDLERKGASFKAVNVDGKTAPEIADENENDEIVHYIMGRDYYQMCTNFVQGDLVRLRDQLTPQRLDDVRADGQDVRRHLINTLRDFRIDINQFLLDLGSGPVLEAVDT